MKDNEKLKLDAIYYRDDELYGLIYYTNYRKEPEKNEIKIPVEDIKEIHLLNRNGSKIVSFVVVIVSGVYIGIAIYAFSALKDFDVGIWP
jgi:hypothetical protein